MYLLNIQVYTSVFVKWTDEYLLLILEVRKFKFNGLDKIFN
jgi:hypothetical protein